MKRLLCAVLLTCAYASAQQINPNQIQPSLTNGYVLTTVSGAAVWAPSSGGCGATGSAPQIMVFTATGTCSGDPYLEDFAATSSGTGFLQSTSNGAQFSNSLGGSYRFIFTGNGGAYDNGADFVFDTEETGVMSIPAASFEVTLQDDVGNNNSAIFEVSTSGTTGSETGDIDLSALCTSGSECGNVNLSAQSSGGNHTGQVNINADTSGSGTDSGAVLISSSGGSGPLGGAISLAAATTIQLYGQTTGIGVEIGAIQTMIQNPSNNGYGTIDTTALHSTDTWDYTLPRLTGTFTLYTGTLTPNDCVIINGTGTGIVDAGTSSCNGGGGGGSAFSAITSGTNTAATMTVGTGGTLTFSGTGVNNASEINGVTVTGTAASGKAIVATSSSAADWQAIPSGVTWPASGDLVISNTTNTPVGLAPVNGDCAIGSGGAWTVGSCGGTVYPSAGVANSTGSAWGTSYQVGTAANDLVQLNASAQLPAVSGVNLTNLNGSNISSGTVGSAYLPLGSSSAFGALKCGSGTSCSAGVISVSGGGGLTGSGTADYYALWTGTTALGNGNLDDGVSTAGVITSSEPVTVNATTKPSEITLTYNSGHAPSGTSGSAVIAPDTSGNFDVSENGASLARVCTATNGVCSTGGSGFPITLGSTSIAASSTTTSLAGLTVNGVSLTTGGSANNFLNGTGSYAAPFTLTTTGSSGAATFSGGTLNIPQYSGGGMVYPGAGVANSTGSAWGTSYSVNGSGAGLTSGPSSSTSGDVADFTGTTGQIADSGTLLSSLAPKASPTFTGTVTLPVTGSTQCLQVNTSGNVSGTGSTCGSGGGGVSSFSGDGTLLSNSSSTGAVTATLANAAAHEFWGNNTGSSAAPGYDKIGAQDWSVNAYIAGGGTAQAQTATLSPAVTSLVAGLEVRWLPTAANTAAAPTLAVNGLTAKNITKLGTTALVANDLTTSAVADAIYDGTQWELQNPQTTSGGSSGVPWLNVTNPSGLTMTWMNQGTATESVGSASRYLLAPAVSGNSIAGRCIAAGTAPYSIAVGILPLTRGENFAAVGMYVTDGTKLVDLGPDILAIAVQEYTNSTTFSSTPFSFTPGFIPSPLFLKIYDDGTNLNFEWSADGTNWSVLYSQGRTSYLSSVADYCYFANSNNSGVPVSLSLISWTQGTS